ncbi:MAG: hypothetical protein WCK13_05735 [Ignavibacteriota bacterium]|nr:hypothetical protein [Ignavibacteriota bacterium]
MNLLITILNGIGFLSLAVALMAVINTMFDLHMKFKGSYLPKDYVSAIMIGVFGILVLGINLIITRFGKKSKTGG